LAPNRFAIRTTSDYWREFVRVQERIIESRHLLDGH
jgi:hypothetical protein